MVQHDSLPPRSGLGPPRFGIRALFTIMTIVGAAIVIWQWVGPAVGMSLLMIALVLFAHVAGNAMGSRLRDTAPMDWHRPSGEEHAQDAGRLKRGTLCPDEHFAPVTHLSHRVPLARFLLIVTACGGLASGLAGAWFLHWLYPRTANWLTLLVGGCATGAICAVFSFWLLSLAHVFLNAWWQAHRHSEGKKELEARD